MKPYKKHFKKDEKVYFLQLNWLNKTVGIFSGAAMGWPPNLYPRNEIYLSCSRNIYKSYYCIPDNDQFWRVPSKTNCQLWVENTLVAPRTKDGKQFLINRAKKLIYSEIGKLTKRQNECRRMLRTI